MSIASYLYYVIFCLIMVFSPGPMTMLLMSIGVEHGVRRTMPAQLGASSAYFISLLIFAVGLTAILKQHDIILMLIQYFGVMYILYLAWKQWQNSRILNFIITTQHVAEIRPSQLYRKGLITGISNPKTLVMFSTVIPQFSINPGTKTIDISILSITFLVLQFLSGVTYSYFGQAIKKLLQTSNFRKYIYQAMSILLVIVAVMLANITML